MSFPRTAIAGVGYSPITRSSGTTVLDLAATAVKAAVADAGLSLQDIDGVASFSYLSDSASPEAVATTLGLPRLNYTIEWNNGGQSPSALVQEAAMAVATGRAENVVVFRALNGRSGARVGSTRIPGGAGEFRYPIGYTEYLMYVAMWARRYLHETGQTEDALGEVAVAQRRHAQRNDRAVRTADLDLDGYHDSPLIAAPFRIEDCTTEVDGACALLVTSLDRARDLRHPPAVVAASAYVSGPRTGLDIGDHLGWADYTRNFSSFLPERLYPEAGIGPEDVDLAQIYDCFTSVVLMGLEGLGLCARGEAGAFVASGATGLDGSLPVNTNGGLLNEGYLHGMNTVAEAVLQVQGRAGDRQVPRHEVALVTSGALMNGSGMVLTVDR